MTTTEIIATIIALGITVAGFLYLKYFMIPKARPSHC